MSLHPYVGGVRFARITLNPNGLGPERMEMVRHLFDTLFPDGWDGWVFKGDINGITNFGDLQADLSAKRTSDLKFMVFDLLYLDGFRLEQVPLLSRKGLLARALETKHDDRIRYSEHQIGHGPEFFKAAAAVPLEGIISKRCDAPYRSGRGPNWVKTKALGREELVVVGFSDPERSRVGFGSLLLGYYNPSGELIYGGKVGTGYSDVLLVSLRKRLDALTQSVPTVMLPKGISRTGIHWVKPEIVVETSFTEWTSDGVLRHPSFLGVREDKAPREVVLDKQLNPNAATSKWAKMRRQSKSRS